MQRLWAASVRSSTSNSKPPVVEMPGSRRVEAQADRLGDRQQFRAHGGNDARGTQPGAPLIPWLQTPNAAAALD